MAGWMNEYDVEDALYLFLRADGATPNLYDAAMALDRLVRWTNENSDGWAYWPKPSRAASKLQQLLQDGKAALRRGELRDATDAELRAALVPIKAFRTRQGADFQLV